MKEVVMLSARHLKLFLMNKKNVALSFLSVVIVIGLYAIFLRDFILSSVLSHLTDHKLAEEFTDRMMYGGLLVVVNTTTCFGIMQERVKDYASGVQRDFLIAPVTRMELLDSYWISSTKVSFFFTVFTMAVGEVYFKVGYSRMLNQIELLQSLGVILVCSITNSAILLCLTTFIKDTTSFSTFGNLYGMLIGFLGGVYLPYQLYPEKLRNWIFYYPPTQLVSILRRIYVGNWTDRIGKRYGNQVADRFNEMYGIYLTRKGTVYTCRQQWVIVILGFTIFLIFLTVMNQERKELSLHQER